MSAKFVVISQDGTIVFRSSDESSALFEAAKYSENSGYDFFVYTLTHTTKKVYNVVCEPAE